MGRALTKAKRRWVHWVNTSMQQFNNALTHVDEILTNSAPQPWCDLHSEICFPYLTIPVVTKDRAVYLVR